MSNHKSKRMKRLMICFLMAMSSIAVVCAQNPLPLLKEGTRVSIPLNKKGTKGLDIFVKSMTYRDSTDRSCQADIILVFTSRNEKIHFGRYKDIFGSSQVDYRFAFNMFNIDGILPKNESFEKKVSIWLKEGIYRDSILTTLDGKKLMYIPSYDSEEFIQKEKARKRAVELANRARLDSINNARLKDNNEIQERREKLLTPEYLANWVGASFFTKENIEKDCDVYPMAYSGGKVFYDFPQCPVTMEFADHPQVCIYVSFRLFGEDGYKFRTQLLNFGYKLKSKSNALVAENNFGDLTNGKVSVYKYPLKNGGYSVCKITEGQAFMFEFYRSKH